MPRTYKPPLSVILVMTTAALAQPGLTLMLESSKAGETVAPGAAIDWTIKVTVSTGDNAGLALISCDLAQDVANPAKLDIPPGSAGSIDATMQNFSRPLGIANPGDGGAMTGYVGVQRGSTGQKNLIQIGGGQNTFGTALPAGTGVGESATVIAGVGQSGPQTVLSGLFAAPTGAGTYTFRLTNALANVLTAVNPPPAISPVGSATVNVSGATFMFTVSAGRRGDLNCDGSVNFKDINPFVLFLSNLSAWQAANPGCNPQNGDINADGTYPSFGDINPFVALLSGGG